MQKRTVNPNPKIINNTKLSLATITSTLTKVGFCRNEWRQRNVSLYAVPEDDSNVISIGETFDGSQIIIALEPRNAFSNTLAEFPRTHIYR